MPRAAGPLLERLEARLMLDAQPAAIELFAASPTCEYRDAARRLADGRRPSRFPVLYAQEASAASLPTIVGSLKSGSTTSPWRRPRSIARRLFRVGL